MRVTTGTEPRRWASILLPALATAAVLGAAAPARASGGMGSVEQVSATANSMAIKWDFGSEYTPQGAAPYKICWKIGGDIEGACSGGWTDRSATKSYTLTGLTSDRKYKIKVLCDCKKNNRNNKERKVGTLTVTTPLPSRAPPLLVTTAGQFGFTVAYNYPTAPQHQLLLIYKAVWSPSSNWYRCDNPGSNGPNGWGAGLYNLNGAAGSFATTAALRRNTRYQIALCDSVTRKLVAEVRAKTAK